MILDNTADRIKAAASFQYKNWTVGLSTIFNKDRMEVLIWKDTEQDQSFVNVENAITYINNLDNN